MLLIASRARVLSFTVVLTCGGLPLAAMTIRIIRKIYSHDAIDVLSLIAFALVALVIFLCYLASKAVRFLITPTTLAVDKNGFKISAFNRTSSHAWRELGPPRHAVQEAGRAGRMHFVEFAHVAGDPVRVRGDIYRETYDSIFYMLQDAQAGLPFAKPEIRSRRGDRWLAALTVSMVLPYMAFLLHMLAK